MGPLHGFAIGKHCLGCFAVNAHVYIQAVTGKQRLAGITTYKLIDQCAAR